MMSVDWVFDILLGVTLLWLGASTIFMRDQFTAIIAYIAFGMLMALAWLRLGAVDVALAEAALGGGVTGALLFAAINRLNPSTPEKSNSDESR